MCLVHGLCVDQLSDTPVSANVRLLSFITKETSLLPGSNTGREKDRERERQLRENKKKLGDKCETAFPKIKNAGVFL